MTTPCTFHHLLGLDSLAAEEIQAIFTRAMALLPTASGSSPPLTAARPRMVANLFVEDSTRTRMSFSRAAQLLGHTVLDLTESGSSASKGETMLDSALNLRAMGVNAVVVRTAASGGAKLLAQRLDCAVVNAGDGRHEHPTQGLLDILTLQEALGSVQGRAIGIVGDIANSRVARSDLLGLTALGARVVLIGPPPLLPIAMSGLARSPGSASIEHDLDRVLPTLDAIIMLRVQTERAAGGGIASDYRTWYGLTAHRLARMANHAVVMHPGPMNRGQEIDGTVADGPRSVILRQVSLGVAVRMAVLERALSN